MGYSRLKLFFISNKNIFVFEIGYTGGIEQLETFINERVFDFAIGRNNPNKTALSNLSPWFHYGQISPQRALLIIAKLRSKYKDACDSFIEEAFVRRELSDNYCFYQENCTLKKNFALL